MRKHGRPAESRHSLQIEIKRTLYMDEETLEPNAGSRASRRDLARLTATLAAHVRDAANRADAMRCVNHAPRDWSDHLTGCGVRC